MNRRITFLPAALLAIFNSYAQQPTPNFTFKSLPTGGNVAGFTLPSNAVIDCAALSDTGEAAIVVEWSEAGKQHTAVLTSNPSRLVAKDGNTVEGRLVTHVMPTSLAVTGGHVAYEAIFGEPGQTGIFVNGKFIVALSQAGSSEDFVLNDDGKIALKAATAAPQVQTPATAKKPSPWQRAIGLKIPDAVARRIYGAQSPVATANPNVLTQPPQTQPTLPRTQPIQSKPNTPAHACSSQDFPYPPAWKFGDTMQGPIMSHAVDTAKGKSYQSPFFGTMKSPTRIIQCSGDGHPLLIVIADDADHYEVMTANGLLTRSRPGGYLDLPGISGNVLAASLVRADTPLRINKVGQILMPVVTIEPEGHALLLATPRH